MEHHFFTSIFFHLIPKRERGAEQQVYRHEAADEGVRGRVEVDALEAVGGHRELHQPQEPTRSNATSKSFWYC